MTTTTDTMTAARDAIAAHQAARGLDRTFAFGARNRALDALYAELTTREDGEQLTALATDADLIDLVHGRQSIAHVNARRR